MLRKGEYNKGMEGGGIAKNDHKHCVNVDLNFVALTLVFLLSFWIIHPFYSTTH